MRMVFLAHNGVGLGHLVRLHLIAEQVHHLDGRVVFFLQGPVSNGAMGSFPCAFIPQLWSAPDRVRAESAADIRSVLELSAAPTVLVEDTHPSKILTSSSTVRVLVVRPVDWNYLCRLQNDYGDSYDRFILADSPFSPTWPYSEEETAEIITWPRWRISGPVYRRATQEERDRVRIALSIADDTRVCVFTMGGGGQHPQHSDIGTFVESGARIAESIRSVDPKARMLFVRGPLFPPGESVPPIFEVIDEEPAMHALLSVASLAVVRPGFNTTWECISGGTMPVPLLGTSYIEPVAARVDRLTSFGLTATDPVAAWKGVWQDEYRTKCHALDERFAGGAASIAAEIVALAKLPHQRPPLTGRQERRVLILATDRFGLGTLSQCAHLVKALKEHGCEGRVVVEADHLPLMAPSDELPWPSVAPEALGGPDSPAEKVAHFESALVNFDPEIVLHDGDSQLFDAVTSLSGLGPRYAVAIRRDNLADHANDLPFGIDVGITRVPYDADDFGRLCDTTTGLVRAALSTLVPNLSLGQRLLPKDARGVATSSPEISLRGSLASSDGVASVVERLASADLELESLSALNSHVASLVTKPCLWVRVDDVETIDSSLRSCLRDLLSLGLHISLEVIPYSHSVSEDELNTLDSEGRLEVSQHGYSHLPRRWPPKGRGEFSLGVPLAAEHERIDISRGHRLLSSTFGPRFAGGFSAPYDAMPRWLGAVWSELGGRYVSYIWSRPPGTDLPAVQLSVEPWNWRQQRRWSSGAIIRMIRQSIALRGTVGIVLHPVRFSQADDWQLLMKLLEGLVTSGAISQKLSQSASALPHLGSGRSQTFSS